MHRVTISANSLDADEGRSMTAAQTKKRNVLVIEDEPIHPGVTLAEAAATRHTPH